MAAAPTQTRPRRTQAERSATTRALLLDATIECLIDLGYAGTTTTEVAERAGVSRGAQLHHFPTKTDLVLSAVAHLAQKQAEDFGKRASLLREQHSDEPALLLELVWESFSGPLFYAALELWVAARTDTELHGSVYDFERNVWRAIATLWQELAHEITDVDPRFDEILQLSFHLLRGMSLQKILRDDDAERRRLFERWKSMAVSLLSHDIAPTV